LLGDGGAGLIGALCSPPAGIHKNGVAEYGDSAVTERVQSNFPGGLRKFIGVLLLFGTVGLSTCQAYRHDGTEIDQSVGVRSELERMPVVAWVAASPAGWRLGAR